MLATFLQDQDLRRVAEAVARRAREAVRHCETHDELCARARDVAARGLIVDLNGWVAANTSEFLNALHQRGESARLFLILGFAPQECRVALSLVQQAASVVAIFARPEAGDLLLANGDQDAIATASVHLLRQVPTGISPELGRLVVACVVLGDRRLTARRLASELGVGITAVRTSVRALGFQNFRQLAAAVRIAHALYRIEHLNMPRKAAVSAGGFGDGKAFRKSVRRWSSQNSSRVGTVPVRFSEIARWWVAQLCAAPER